MADTARRIIAILLALRALSNLGKPFGTGSGFVVGGHVLHGVASTVVAPLFGVAMLIYAYALWHARPYARPLGIAYALWATANVLLFPLVDGVPAQYPAWSYVFYAVPGVAVPWLAVWLLGRPMDGAPGTGLRRSHAG